MSKKNSARLPPVHPGKILEQDLMKPFGLTASELARELRISVSVMREIINGRRALDADAALRLSRYFGSSTEFWINLQAVYDLRLTINSSARRRDTEVRPRRKA